MRIMCLNAWGGRLYEPLALYLAKMQPDVLCLQEVVHTPLTERPWLIYRDAGIELPQRANLFDDVRGLLPEHTATFCPAAQGDLWDGDERIVSQWGLATFVRRSLPIIAQAQGFVHGVFSPDGYGEHPRSRTGHAVRIFDFEAGGAVTVAHMHGLRDPAGKHDTPERRLQAARLKALVETVAESGDGVVVCGDFNVNPDSETFGVLADLGLSDLVVGRGFASTRTSHYRKENRFADYMLVNPALAGAEFEVVATPEVSDHCPLVLSFA